MHAVLVIELQGLNINYSLLTVFGGVKTRGGEVCPVDVMNAERMFREGAVLIEVEEVERGFPEACLQKCRVATLEESGSHSCFKSTLPRNKHKELPHFQECRPFFPLFHHCIVYSLTRVLLLVKGAGYSSGSLVFPSSFP